MGEEDRYSKRNILRSEKMYGEGHQSPGGERVVGELAKKLGDISGKRVLDIGSGLGGSLFYLAEKFNMSGVGIDCSEAMVEESSKRAVEKGLNVEFVKGDFNEVDIEKGGFDVVWSRDAILYAKDKGKVFAKAYGSLKKGGKILVTDFVRGENVNEEFEEYLRSCGYYLDKLDDYKKRLEIAGFGNVVAENITDEFVRCLKNEVENLVARKEEFLEDFSLEDFDYLINRWKRKIDMCERGELLWGVFVGEVLV